MKWCNEILGMAENIYFTPQWLIDRGCGFDVDSWVKKMKQSSVDCVMVWTKDHYGHCLFKSSEGRNYEIDVFGKIVEGLRPAGIKIVAHYSLGWDKLAGEENPTWNRRDPDGNIIYFVQEHCTRFNWMCLNTPYRYYALALMQLQGGD